MTRHGEQEEDERMSNTVKVSTKWPDVLSIEKFQRLHKSAEEHWHKVRKEILPVFWSQDYLMRSHEYDLLLTSDARLEAYAEVKEIIDTMSESNQPPERVVEKIALRARRHVTGYRGAHNSNPMTNIIRENGHVAWLEILEIADPSW
jgi:hypothetical protein